MFLNRKLRPLIRDSISSTFLIEIPSLSFSREANLNAPPPVVCTILLCGCKAEMRVCASEWNHGISFIMRRWPIPWTYFRWRTCSWRYPQFWIVRSKFSRHTNPFAVRCCAPHLQRTSLTMAERPQWASSAQCPSSSRGPLSPQEKKREQWRRK